MSMAARDVTPVETYLELERDADHKHEFVNGEIVAMAGAGPEHTYVQTALTVAIGSRLLGGPCEPHVSDARVRLDETGLYAYPDLTVSCGEAEFSDERPPSLLNPTVVFEVLSESTEMYDRGIKAAHYRQRASIREFVLLSTDAVRAEVYRRLPEGGWKIELVEGDAVLSLPSLSVDVPLAEIYRSWRAHRARIHAI